MQVDVPSNPYKYLIILGFLLVLIGVSYSVYQNEIEIIGGVIFVIGIILGYFGWSNLKDNHNLEIKMRNKKIELLETKIGIEKAMRESIVSEIAKGEKPFDVVGKVIGGMARNNVESRIEQK